MANNDQINQTALLAGVVGQVGCLTVLLIGIALGAGILLDNFLDTSPIFAIMFVVGSVPVTLYVTVRVSLMAVARSQRILAKNKTEEDSEA